MSGDSNANDGLALNDAESKLLAEDENLVRAGHVVRKMGPKFVVIKKGEHKMCVMPAYPTPQVPDPTGRATASPAA